MSNADVRSSASPHVRRLAGLAMVVVIAGTFLLAVRLFRGGFGEQAPITVVSERAGLVMNPDAKVKWHGVAVGRVDRIEARQDGKAVLYLAMDPTQLQNIPDNVTVDITSST